MEGSWIHSWWASSKKTRMGVEKGREPLSLYFLHKASTPTLSFYFYRWYHSHTPTFWWPICVVLGKKSVVTKNISEFVDLFLFESSALWGMVTKCSPHVIWPSFLSQTSTYPNLFHIISCWWRRGAFLLGLELHPGQFPKCHILGQRSYKF